MCLDNELLEDCLLPVDDSRLGGTGGATTKGTDLVGGVGGSLCMGRSGTGFVVEGGCGLVEEGTGGGRFVAEGGRDLAGGGGGVFVKWWTWFEAAGLWRDAL